VLLYQQLLVRQYLCFCTSICASVLGNLDSSRALLPLQRTATAPLQAFQALVLEALLLFIPCLSLPRTLSLFLRVAPLLLSMCSLVDKLCALSLETQEPLLHRLHVRLHRLPRLLLAIVTGGISIALRLKLQELPPNLLRGFVSAMSSCTSEDQRFSLEELPPNLPEHLAIAQFLSLLAFHTTT
jgi:hypothetical protein